MSFVGCENFVPVLGQDPRTDATLKEQDCNKDIMPWDAGFCNCDNNIPVFVFPEPARTWSTTCAEECAAAQYSPLTAIWKEYRDAMAAGDAEKAKKAPGTVKIALIHALIITTGVFLFVLITFFKPKKANQLKKVKLLERTLKNM